MTQGQFISQAIKVHGSKYLYNNTNYNNAKEKIIVTCTKHGDFLIWPSNHLNGAGCTKCNHEDKNLSTADFIERANQVHNNKYDYSNTVYTTSKSKLSITCPIHGEFEQLARNHLQGQGCKECALIYDVRIKGYVNNYCKNYTKSNLYILKMYNDNESFYKIGISVNVKNRVGDIRCKSEYNVELLYSQEGLIEEIPKLEQYLHSQLKEYKYKPTLEFGGSTECFSNIDQVYNLIKELYANSTTTARYN